MNLAEMKQALAAGDSLTRIGMAQGGLSAKQVRAILARAGVDVYAGRWQPDTTERDARLRALISEGLTVRVICERIGCSVTTVTRMKRQMKSEAKP